MSQWDSAPCARRDRRGKIAAYQRASRPCPRTPGLTISYVGLPGTSSTARPPWTPAVLPNPHHILLSVFPHLTSLLQSRFSKQLSLNPDFYFHIVSELPYARTFLHCLSFATVTSRMAWLVHNQEVLCAHNPQWWGSEGGRGAMFTLRFSACRFTADTILLIV